MVVAVAASKAVTRLLEAVQVCVFAMEAGSVARLRDALKVQKDTLGYASHMVADVGEFRYLGIYGSHQGLVSF